MLTFKNYLRAKTLEEAYEILTKERNSRIIGGGAYLKMGSNNLSTVIDLEDLELQYIKEEKDEVRIGAMTTYRDLEKSEILNRISDGLIKKSVEDIVGVQLRNVVRVGGSVYSKYGFSDLIPVLVALKARVVLYKNKEMSIVEFLEKNIKDDILVEVIIPKKERKGSFENIRKSKGDYSLLNIAVVYEDEKLEIAVGARPGMAKVPVETLKNIKEVNKEDVKEIAKKVAEELDFGDNMRASKEYRKNLCKVLVERAIREVI